MALKEKNKTEKGFLFSFLGVSATVPGVFTAFPPGLCLEESSLSDNGLHWLPNFPVRLTAL